MPNANSATAADFDRAAQGWANWSWGWLVCAALVGWLASVWWAALPGAFVIYCVIASVSSTRAAGHLRAGTFRLPNPNNGAPDGDARNLPMHGGLGEKWERAIKDFGSIMGRHPLTVFPDSHLPLPKAEMKAALKAAWTWIDDPTMRQQIEIRYIHLSQFRAEVSNPVDLELRPNPNLSLEEIARHVLERQSDLQMWKPVTEESKQLLSEFAAFKAQSAH